jgi:hypothetical protein
MRHKANIEVIVALVGIFFFPIAFQSLHNISYHLPHTHVCCDAPKADVNIESDAFNCPILSYESAVTDLPGKAFFITALQAGHVVFFINYENPVLAFASSQIQLRAPPKTSMHT